MPGWMMLAIGLIFGGLIGMMLGFTVGDGAKHRDLDGMLVVDPTEVTPGDGLYLQMWKDPKGMDHGDYVTLRISMIGKK